MANQLPRFCRQRTSGRPRQLEPNGSARICMGAMSSRKGTNPVPGSLLIATV